jgi:two-component system chemotaxis response regulator CheB
MVREAVQLGHPSHLSCPQCGGVLNEVTDEGSTRFRCQIGHAFTAEALLAAQNEELDRAMESALRMHRERMVLFRRMEEKSEAQAMPHAAGRWRTGADESEHAAKVIGEALANLRRHGGVTTEH